MHVELTGPCRARIAMTPVRDSSKMVIPRRWEPPASLIHPTARSRTRQRETNAADIARSFLSLSLNMDDGRMDELLSCKQ